MLGAGVAGVAGMLPFVPVAPAGAVSVICDNWAGVSASWFDGTDWSSGVPTSSTIACLPAGSYTVTIPGPGSGNGGAQVGTLTIASGPTLVITHDSDNNNGSLTASSSVTNAGTIQVGDSASNVEETLAISGGTLTNTGTLETEGCCNTPEAISGSIDNEGTFSVTSGSEAELSNGGATFTNTGAITIASSDNFNVTGGTFDLNGGTLTNDGTFTQEGGSFNHNGGTASGNYLNLENVAIAPDPSSDSAGFDVYGSSTLTSDVSAGDTLVITHDSDNNNGSLTASSDVTNAGTIQVGDSASNVEETLAIGGGTLTNTGTLETEGCCNTPEVISGSIDNEGTFSVTSGSEAELESGVIDDYGSITVADGDSLTNSDDTLVVEPGGTFSLGSSGTYTQQSGATLGVTVDATDNTYTGISGGNTSLSGALQVTTVGLPELGSTWPIIAGASSSGTFSSVGPIDYTADYSGTGVTLVAPALTTTATEPTTTRGTTTALPGAGVPYGSVVYDAATVTGNSPSQSPTGTASFYVCSPAVLAAHSATTCSSSITSAFDTETLPAGSGGPVTAFSVGQTVNSIGSWCFAGYYSGDTTFPASADQSSDECFTVTKAVSTTTTKQSVSGGSVTLGASGPVTDTATVKGNAAGGAPTGTVSFYWCYSASASPTSCSTSTPGVTPAGTPTLTTGSGDQSKATSTGFTPSEAGDYCFFATYIGNSIYNGSSDTSTASECFTVNKIASTTATQQSVSGGSVTLGTSGPVTDTATVTGNAAGGAPTGTVSFYWCYSASASPTSCRATTHGATPAGTPTLTTGTPSADQSQATSTGFTPSMAGDYCFFATYVGSSIYQGSSDTSTSTECFTINRIASSTATQQSVSGGSVTLGASGKVTDTATVTGNAAGDAPNGTVSFYWCYSASVSPTSCNSTTAGATPAGTRTLTNGSPSVDQSTATSTGFTPSKGGYYCFFAAYGGSSVYVGSSDTSTSGECFTVTPAASTTTAGFSLLLGADSVVDTATVTGNSTGGAPTGTVNFYWCYSASASPTSCNATGPDATSAGAPTLTTGTPKADQSQATSTGFTPSQAGYYCFFASYGGDPSYLGSSDTSAAGQCFTVTEGPSAS